MYGDSGRGRPAENGESECGVDGADTVTQEPLVLRLGEADAAERATDIDRCPLAQPRVDRQLRVLDSEEAGSEGELGETVEPVLASLVHVSERVEVINLCGNA